MTIETATIAPTITIAVAVTKPKLYGQQQQQQQQQFLNQTNSVTEAPSIYKWEYNSNNDKNSKSYYNKTTATAKTQQKDTNNKNSNNNNNNYNDNNKGLQIMNLPDKFRYGSTLRVTPEGHVSTLGRKSLLFQRIFGKRWSKCQNSKLTWNQIDKDFYNYNSTSDWVLLNVDLKVVENIHLSR